MYKKINQEHVHSPPARPETLNVNERAYTGVSVFYFVPHVQPLVSTQKRGRDLGKHSSSY